MFFNESVVYKTFTTQKGAERYIAKHLANQANVTVQVWLDTFAVVGA